MGDNSVKRVPFSEELFEKIRSGEIKGTVGFENPKFGEPYKYIDIFKY